MFAGKTFTMNGRDVVVPPLALGNLRNGILEKLKQHDEMLKSESYLDTLSLKAEVILAAIRRNYPDFSEEELVNYLDMGNITTVWNHVLGISGFLEEKAQATVAGT